MIATITFDGSKFTYSFLHIHRRPQIPFLISSSERTEIRGEENADQRRTGQEKGELTFDPP